MKSAQNQKTVLVNSPKYPTVKTPVCHNIKHEICQTCKSPIEDSIYRFLVVKDELQKHKLISFHYFFPCWDVSYIFQNLIECEISKAGFSCDASLLKNPKAVKNLRKNGDLWDL